MRDIKFRGKSLSTGEWLHGSLVWNTGRAFIFETDLDAMIGKVRDCEVLPGSIGQYTGMKDRLGVDIYEGDVLYWFEFGGRHMGYGSQGAMHWDKHTMSWALLRDRLTADGRLCIVPRPYDKRHLEVVGNITDNPELMERVSHDRHLHT
jgi:uncharacterized phage protein (TIGR01671 family)